MWLLISEGIKTFNEPRLGQGSSLSSKPGMKTLSRKSSQIQGIHHENDQLI